MAQGLRFVCGNCHKAIEAWDDGNPYYLDEAGKKHYAYHPHHEELERCIGNDSPHLCLACGEEFDVDSRTPADQCPKCRSASICETYALDGNNCPFCKKGSFSIDPKWLCIS